MVDPVVTPFVIRTAAPALTRVAGRALRGIGQIFGGDPVTRRVRRGPADAAQVFSFRQISPIPSAEAATVAGPKIGNMRGYGPPPPLVNPPATYQPPPSGPDWNPPPLYPGGYGTPPINPTGPTSLPVIGVWDPLSVIRDVMTWRLQYGPFGIPKIPKAPPTPAGREDPFSQQAQADMRRAEAAQEREIRREERAEERAQVRAEREAERRQAEYERAAGTRRQAEAMAGLEWNPYISPGREMDPRPRQTIGESEAVLASPPARVAGNPWATYARAALPFLPLLSSLTQPGKGRRRRRDPLTQPQTDGNPFPGNLTGSYPQSVSFGAFGGTPGAVGTNTCECKAPRKKRRKKKRVVCYAGTYREKADGTRKVKKRKVPCT